MTINVFLLVKSVILVGIGLYCLPSVTSLDKLVVDLSPVLEELVLGCVDE